jgi:hypothetical protein
MWEVMIQSFRFRSTTLAGSGSVEFGLTFTVGMYAIQV